MLYIMGKNRDIRNSKRGTKSDKKKDTKSYKKKDNKTYKNRKSPKKTVIIGMVFADWCGHCVRLKPEWAKMKSKIRNNMGRSLKNMTIEFVELGDTQENQMRNISVDQLVSDFNKKHFPMGEQALTTEGFPTIFRICNKKIDYYKDERISKNLYKWATQKC
jgi:thiol-disulfide isomerase/thioredoxin